MSTPNDTERLDWLEARVVVVEPGHVADVHAVPVQVIEKAAAIGAGIHGPADRMLDQSRFRAAGRELPQFLDAEPECLRLAAIGEAQPRNELLGNAAAAALG